MSMTLQEIADEFGGELIGENATIDRLARLEDSGSGDLSFLQVAIAAVTLPLSTCCCMRTIKVGSSTDALRMAIRRSTNT